MAFFNDLGKKISQTSQDVVKKAKDSSEISKLNGAIADEDRKINSIYLQIGKLYFDLYKDNCDPTFAELVSQINECEARKVTLAEQIEKVKGLKKCPKCGAEIPYASKFCNFCGLSIDTDTVEEVEETVQANTCKSCGSVLDGSSAFCGNCGAKAE